MHILYLELELDPSLVLGIDLEDGPEGAVAGLPQHETLGPRLEELLNRAVSLGSEDMQVISLSTIFY